MKISYLFKTILSLLFFLSFVSCDRKTEKETPLRNIVLTHPVSLSNNSSTVYPGVIEEGASISASFMADGKIGKINVKEGDRVSKGQLLASIDDTDYRIGVSQLEAQYEQMTKEKQRMDAMFEKHNIAPNDYEKFSAGYEQLKLQMEMAKRQLDYTRLYSPSNGYVATKYMTGGELVGAGTPVFRIIDDSQLLASVDLPVNVYLYKDNITSATGKVPGIEAEFPLQIVSFTPDADNNMLYHLKLSLPSKMAKELTPGMNISVKLNTTADDRRGAMVPSRAIFADSGETYVWVFNPEDSTINKKQVKIEGLPSGRMNIVEGLSGDEDIVETGVKQLYDGEKVNVLNRTDLGI